MAAFVPRFRDIMAKHGAEGAYYGHCSVGCLHIRPLINLKTQRGLDQVQAMAGEIFDMVLEFEGAISSEHGDGRARSPYLERVFGPVVFGAFRELKAAFDPKNLLNPGNIVASPGVTEHMRYGAQYKTWEPKTLLDFREQGGFAAAVEMCNGVGVCRKNLEGTMCPSYMATRDEEHSTRGRANALRAVLSGRVPEADFTGRRLYEVMDLCLECKGCKAECPSNVDMAKMKYEFLHHYYKVHPTPMRNDLFAHIGDLSWWGSRLAPLSNWIGGWRINRWLLDVVVGVDRRRPLPAFARRSFTDWFDAAQAEPRRPARQRGALPRHLQDLQHPRDRPGGGGAAGGGGLSRGAGGAEVLRAAADLQGHARRGARPCRVERDPADAVGGARGPGGGARAVLPPHAARRVRGSPPHRRRPRGGALELSPRGVPASRARAGAHAAVEERRARARRSSTGTATRRPWWARRPRWPRWPGRATRCRRWTPAAAAWRAPSASRRSTTISR